MTFDSRPDHVTRNFFIVGTHFEFHHSIRVFVNAGGHFEFLSVCPATITSYKKARFSTKISTKTKVGMRKTKMMVPTTNDHAYVTVSKDFISETNLASKRNSAESAMIFSILFPVS